MTLEHTAFCLQYRKQCQVHPSCLPISLFSIIRGFQKFAGGADQNSICLMGDKTLNIRMRIRFILRVLRPRSVKRRGSGSLNDKEGKVLHGAAVNKPSKDTQYTSSWTNEKI
jgi:hypothetical protein